MEKVYVAIVQYQKNNKQMLKESYYAENLGKGFYGKEQERVVSPAPRINKHYRLKMIMTALKDAIIWSKKMGLKDVSFLIHDRESFGLIDKNVYYQRESKEVNALIYFISNLLTEEGYELHLLKNKKDNQAFNYAQKRTIEAKKWEQIKMWNQLRADKKEAKELEEKYADGALMTKELAELSGQTVEEYEQSLRNFIEDF